MSQCSDIRRRLIQSFTDICRRDDRVLASFIGGSIATGMTDEFSDLDLYAIIRPDAYDQFLAEHREFVERLAKPVFLERFDDFGFDMLVFIFENGVQGELAIARPDYFLHIHGGPYKILVDKQRLLEGVVFPWARPTQEEQIEQLRRQLNWFWRDVSLFNVAMERDHIWTAYGYLESMRQRCIHLVRLDEDFESWSAGYEKLERVIDESELSPLRGAFCRVDPGAIAEAVKVLINFYRDVGARLATRHGIDYPTSLENVVLAATSKPLRGFEILNR